MVMGVISSVGTVGYIAFSAGIYLAAKYDTFERFSRSDKTQMILTAIPAIDVLVTPIFSGGKSAHEMLGLSPGESTETIAQTLETAVVGLSLVYHSYRVCGRVKKYLKRPKRFFPSDGRD